MVCLPASVGMSQGHPHNFQGECVMHAPNAHRGGNRRLTALRLVREGEAADVWAAYQGQSSGAGLPPPLGDEFVLGDRVPDYDSGKCVDSRRFFGWVEGVSNLRRAGLPLMCRPRLRDVQRGALQRLHCGGGGAHVCLVCLWCAWCMSVCVCVHACLPFTLDH